MKQVTDDEDFYSAFPHIKAGSRRFTKTLTHIHDNNVPKSTW